MIAALANGGALLGEPGWIEMAKRAFGFIAAEMTRGDRLGHSWRDGRLLFPGLASDFACMVQGRAGALRGNRRARLSRSGARLAARARPALRQSGQWRLFPHRRRRRGPGGASRRATNDDATPNPNAIAAANLVRLAALTGDDAWREQADRLFDGVLSAAGREPDRPRGVAQCARPAPARRRDRRDRVGRAGATRCSRPPAKLPFLDRIVLRAPSADALPASHPARDKIAAAPQGAAFVCLGERCSLPVVDAARLVDTVRAMRA